MWQAAVRGRILVATVVVLGLIGRAQATHDHLVLPEIPDLGIEGVINGVKRQFRVPADLPVINSLPDKERTEVLENFERIQSNGAIMRRVGGEFFAHDGLPGEPRLTPDYEKQLGKIVISISYGDSLLPNPLYRHEPVLKALPPRSVINIFFPAPVEARIKAALTASGLVKRAILHPSTEWEKKLERHSDNDRFTRWTRDTFMVGRNRAGEVSIFLPLAYALPADLRESDLRFVEARWGKSRELVRLPGFLRGGNLIVADNQLGQRVAFLGADEIRRNRDIFLAVIGMAPPENYLVEIVKRIAGVKKVVVLPNSRHFFHIDMAMIIPGRGLAALVEARDESTLDRNDLEVLIAMRRELASNGFKIAPIPTTTARISAFLSPVNILAYRKKDSTVPKAIGATFPDVTLNEKGQATSLNTLIAEAYRKAGIEMIWVEDRFSDQRGGVHCSILALN